MDFMYCSPKASDTQINQLLSSSCHQVTTGSAVSSDDLRSAAANVNSGGIVRDGVSQSVLTLSCSKPIGNYVSPTSLTAPLTTANTETAQTSLLSSAAIASATSTTITAASSTATATATSATGKGQKRVTIMESTTHTFDPLLPTMVTSGSGPLVSGYMISAPAVPATTGGDDTNDAGAMLDRITHDLNYLLNGSESTADHHKGRPAATQTKPSI